MRTRLLFLTAVLMLEGQSSVDRLGSLGRALAAQDGQARQPNIGRDLATGIHEVSAALLRLEHAAH